MNYDSMLKEINDAFKVSDLVAPKGVKILTGQDQIIAKIEPPTKEEEVVSPPTEEEEVPAEEEEAPAL